MKVILHFRSAFSPPSGIWWQDSEGEVRRFYHNDSALEAVGLRSVGEVADASKVWDALQTFPDRHPAPWVWGSAELKGGTPQQYLRALARSVL